MTTEIAILNRQCIALAADSAVTIGRRRVWKTANKLFSLSPHNDIAIMTFGGGDFVSFPWETIVKSFRSEIATNQFPTVGDCAKAFVEFLASDRFSNENAGKISILLGFIAAMEATKSAIEGKFKKATEFREHLSRCLKQHSEETCTEKPIILNDVKLKDFTGLYSQDILDLAKDIFGQHITAKLLKELVNYCYECFRRAAESSYETGIVVAGFGSKEYFPALATYIVDGKHKGRTRSWFSHQYSHDINDENQSGAIIIPFGQDDIAVLFLEGIARSHLAWLSRSITKLLSNKSNKLCDAYIKDDNEKKVEKKLQETDNKTIVDLLENEFESYRDKNLVQKIMSVVSSLPKEEMAAMAEALVELTSLRRKMDSPLETGRRSYRRRPDFEGRWVGLDEA